MHFLNSKYPAWYLHFGIKTGNSYAKAIDQTIPFILKTTIRHSKYYGSLKGRKGLWVNIKLRTPAAFSLFLRRVSGKPFGRVSNLMSLSQRHFSRAIFHSENTAEIKQNLMCLERNQAWITNKSDKYHTITINNGMCPNILVFWHLLINKNWRYLLDDLDCCVNVMGMSPPYVSSRQTDHRLWIN